MPPDTQQMAALQAQVDRLSAEVTRLAKFGETLAVYLAEERTVDHLVAMGRYLECEEQARAREEGTRDRRGRRQAARPGYLRVVERGRL